MTGSDLNLLCIDGGGIRGLSALYILQKLMEMIRHDDPPKPCDCFDLIGGTSTGGWIAIMLGRLRMSVDECIAAFMDLQDEIFTRSNTRLNNDASNASSPMYDMCALEMGFKNIIASRGLDPESLLKDTGKPSCKVFVTATTAVGPSTEMLSSYFRPRGPSELYKHTKIWEAVRATSATSTFFGPIEIGPQRRKFYDGGALAINPVEKLWEEAADMVEDTDSLRDRLNCLVSIGTGLRFLTSFDDSAEGLLQTLMSIATDAELTADRFQRDKSELFQNKSCYRFNAPSVGNVNLDSPEVKGDVAQMTDYYIGKQETWNSLRQCRSKLLPRVDRPLTVMSMHEKQRALVQRGLWAIERSQYIQYGMDFDIFTSISTYDSDRSLRRLLKSRLPGTTLWLLAQDTFQSWKQTTSGGTFLLSGIIGSGKTLCSATAIEHLMRERVDDHAQIFHFHFQESPISLRSGSAALNALIKQILIINPEQSSLIYDKVILYYGPSATEAIFDDILDDIFLPLLQTINEPIVVVDGLDLCDASDLWQLLLALSTAVGRGCRVFLTGRGQESAEVQKSHNASGLTIGRSIYGVGEDLSRIIRLMIESQSRRSNIATDATLAYMNDFLANHVGTMVLWAKLLLDEIWANCVDDSTIKDYLMNRLPVDLKTTYESCVTRLGARKDTLGKSLLMAVCAAVEPFHIEELQEYLALDEVDSMLVSDPERRPTRDSILNCSVNLIEIDDEDDLVRPIHHTVIQYALDESLRRNTLCRIGRFCVISLENAAALIHMGGPWRMFATIPAGTELSTRILGLLGRPTTVKATLTMPSHQPLRKTATAGSKSFLTYAQRAWLQSNRDVGADIIQVRSFRKLLIEALHHVAYPWSYQVKSWTSYITGLFAWAVVNDHRPLLAFSLEEPALRSRLAGLKLDLKAMPIISAEGGTAAHFAARSGDLTLFKLVYSRRLLNITDDFGKTCIYIAAEQGNLELLVSIMRTYEKSSAKTSRTPSFVVDNRGRNILHAAIEGAHSRCIEVLCERSYDTGGNLALVLAAQHDSNGIYSLQFAIGSGDPAIFSFCLSKIIFATASLPALPVGMWTALLDDAFRLQLWAAMGLILEFHPLAANLEGLLMNWCNIWFATYGSSCTPEDLIRTVYLHNPSAVRSVCAELTGEEIATAGVLCHEVIPITFWKKVPGKEFHNALRLVLITDSMALFKLLMIWNFRNFLHTFENAYHDVRWFDQNPNAISADLYIHAYLCMDLRLKLGKVYEVAASNAFHEELLSSLDLRTHVLRDLSTDLIRPFLGYIQTRDTALIDLDNYLDLSFNRIVYSLAKYFGGSFAHWHGNDILLWVLACNGLSMHMENLLQSSRASPNSRCTAGTTSLWQVCVRGYYHCVPSLLHHGADARICNTLDVQILVGWSATPTPVSPSSPVELLRSTNVADLSHIPARRRQQYHRETLDLLIAAETTGPRLADHVREPSRGR